VEVEVLPVHILRSDACSHSSFTLRSVHCIVPRTTTFHCSLSAMVPGDVVLLIDDSLSCIYSGRYHLTSFHRLELTRR